MTENIFKNGLQQYIQTIQHTRKLEDIIVYIEDFILLNQGWTLQTPNIVNTLVSTCF